MSDKKITENPSMGDLSKFKSLGRQSVDALGGLNLPQLQQGLEAAANGEQITGQKSEQVGLFLKVVMPIIEAGFITQMLSLSQRAQQKIDQGKPQQQGAQQQDAQQQQLAASIDYDELDLSGLREDAEANLFLTENPVSMAILGQYLDPKDANQVQQALRKLEAGEGISGIMGQSLLKYMDVVTDFLEKGGAGLQKLKQTAKSFLGKDIGKGADDQEQAMKMEPNMKDAYDDDPELDKLKKMAGESTINELRKLAGLTEAKGMPSKAHVMKMCKDGMSKAEMLKMHPDADQDKLKKLIDDCKEELKEGFMDKVTGMLGPKEEELPMSDKIAAVRRMFLDVGDDLDENDKLNNAMEALDALKLKDEVGEDGSIGKKLWDASSNLYQAFNDLNALLREAEIMALRSEYKEEK